MSTVWPEGVPARMPAQDRADIEEVYSRYAWGIDLADLDMALSAFADDAWFDHLWQGRVQGHEAIAENLKSLWYDRQHWWFGRQHLFNHFIMTPTETGADVRCFFQIVQYSVDYNTSFLFGIGTRQDELVKLGEDWKFQSLKVNAWRSRDDVPWQGEMKLAARPVTPQGAGQLDPKK